jgi:nucleoside-diphosphate-sugar epimerase
MHKLLIAGSTGFVGKSLYQRINDDEKIVVKTINRDSGDYKFSDLNEVDEKFDLVYILFAALPSKNLSLEDYRKVNVSLTKKLIEKFSPARFVFTSTISIYENSLQKPSKEDSLGLDISDYAKSKLEAEKLFENKNHIVLRLSSLYGPDMKENTFLPLVVNSALKEKEVTLIGDSSRKQNYTYIHDVIDFLIQAANSDEKGIFNAVNDSSHSNFELVSIIKKLLPETEIKTVGNDRKFYSYEISNEKWVNCFNQGSKISLEEGLRKYLEYKQK